MALSQFGFEFTQEQFEIREMMMKFGREDLAPLAAARDKSHEFPNEKINALAAMGGMAMKTAPENDGPGMDNMGYVLAIEALS